MMAVPKSSARKGGKKPAKSRKRSSRERVSKGEVTFLGELETVGAAVEASASVDSEEFFFLYVPGA